MPQSPHKTKLDADADSPTQKRVRLSPPTQLQTELLRTSPLPPLPPLHTVTDRKPPTSLPVNGTTQTIQKLSELRQKYLGDIDMVVQELKNVLAYGPGSACPESPVAPSTVLKLVRTVQTLEKLRALLLMHPARLRKVSLAQLNTVEQQVKTNLLPLATLFRSFDGQQIPEQQEHINSCAGEAESKIKTDQGSCGTKSPRSPSGLSVRAPETPLPQQDWRFLSMALSLQL